jgi:hypothetical protein
MSGTTYYISDHKVKRIYPYDYNTKIKYPILMLLKSSLINNKIAYDLIDTMFDIQQDTINIFINKHIKLTNLYGIFTKNDINIIMIFYKLFYDYGKIYTPQDIKLENIQELIKNVCTNLNRCVKQKLFLSYNQIICNNRLIKKYLKKIQLFYKLFINVNGNNIVFSIKKKKKLLNELWQIVKFSNKQKVYTNAYVDTSC